VAQPYVGEIRMFAGNYAPADWMFCEGQSVAIAENEVLFQLIGTTYGGDGQETFALPDLRGRLPLHQGNGFNLAAMGGVEEVTATVQQVPIHTHPVLGSTAVANQESPGSQTVTAQTEVALYGNEDPFVPMSQAAVLPVGGSQPHTNFQPYLCISFIISLFGIFPSPT